MIGLGFVQIELWFWLGLGGGDIEGGKDFGHIQAASLAGETLAFHLNTLGGSDDLDACYHSPPPLWEFPQESPWDVSGETARMPISCFPRSKTGSKVYP